MDGHHYYKLNDLFYIIFVFTFRNRNAYFVHLKRQVNRDIETSQSRVGD